MAMKTELKKLADKWNDEALAWREAGRLTKNENPEVSARNYARAGILEGCFEQLEDILLRHEKP